MKPIYFPFTYIQKETAAIFHSVWGRFVIYQPLTGDLPNTLRELETDGQVEIRTPDFHDHEGVKKALQQYVDWAHLHFAGGGRKAADYRSLKDSTPFYNDEYVSQIRTDIQRGKEDVKNGGDVAFQARLFLSIAQQHDIQKASMRQALQATEMKEKNLIDDFRIDDEEMPGRPAGIGEPLLPDASENEMAAQRIIAWSRMIVSDAEISGIFFTDNASIMESLKKESEDLVSLAEIDVPVFPEKAEDDIRTRQRRLMEQLMALSHSKWPPDKALSLNLNGQRSHHTGIGMEIFIAPGKTPRTYFSQFIGAPSVPEMTNGEPAPANTLVCFLSIV
jgi:hypothetical protein